MWRHLKYNQEWLEGNTVLQSARGWELRCTRRIQSHTPYIPGVFPSASLGGCPGVTTALQVLPALGDSVSSKSLRSGHRPNSTFKWFCETSYISVPLLPLFSCSALPLDVTQGTDFPWEPHEAQQCMTISKGRLIMSQAFPAWLHLLAGRSVIILQAMWQSMHTQTWLYTSAIANPLFILKD